MRALKAFVASVMAGAAMAYPALAQNFPAKPDGHMQTTSRAH
jgi:hypothetical protein